MRQDALAESCWKFNDQDCRAGLQVFQQDADHVIEGVLPVGAEEWVPITRGVPCFLQGSLRPDFTEFENRHGIHLTESQQGKSAPRDHTRTVETFSDKWHRFTNYGMQESHQEFLFDWYCKKLGLADVTALRRFYSTKSRILEVGPGSGFNTQFMAESTQGMVFAADISEAAYTTFQNTRHLPNCHVVQADLMELPFEDESFDFIIADGVLHHTPDTRAAVEGLYCKLRPGGQFFFYVYKKMGAARQFCDRQISQAFSQLSPEECYRACEGLTELGRELSNLQAKITLEHGIPVLGIPAGTHDVQRLVYYNFAKCFWNDAFDFETNNMVNYDWYHPVYAWQHDEDEIRGWLSDLSGLEGAVFNPANPNGHSVLVTKSAKAAGAAA